MGGKLTKRRVHMTRIQLFHLMQWLEEQANNNNLSGNATEITEQAVQKLGNHVSYYHVKSGLKELGIIPKKREPKDDNELLTRIKRIEKFIALNFPEEWGNL